MNFSHYIEFLLTIGSLFVTKVFSQATPDAVQFFCISPNNRNFQQTVIDDSDLTQKIDVTKPIAFVIHGWLDSTDSILFEIDHQGWPYAVCQQWVEFVETNCCAVNWHRFSFSLVANFLTTLVADNIVAFIRPLIRAGISPNNITIAGHSLGAHAAGFTGQLFLGENVTIDRVFGLDPAGISFTIPIYLPYEYQLNSNDARYVQAIHTTAIYGSPTPFGNADFHINDGVILQPGCVTQLLNITNVQLGSLAACGHYRAVELFYYSLNPKYPFIGSKCQYQHIIGVLNNVTQMCTSSQTDRMGIYTKELSGNFEVPTTDRAPYCEGCS